MIRIGYDEKYNTVVVEFVGRIDAKLEDQYLLDIRRSLPKHKKGFKLLVDLSAVENMDLEMQGAIIRAMDLFNTQGVTKIIRVIPDPAKDIGFNILSIFHYSKDIKILTVQTRKEADAHVRSVA
jgi:anti-anti-sigma regulatory factor